MVTCESANQLQTPANVSWAFKMVSQFGSLGYTIMRKTADLTVVQKTIIDTLHKEGKPQTFIAKEAGCSQSAVHRVLLTESWVEGKSVEEKDAQPTERTWILKLEFLNRFCFTILKRWGLWSKIDSRIWVNFTRNGLTLGSRHQEPPHTDVSRNLATVVVRGVLPGLRRRRTGLLPSGPKSSFQMRASFVFYLETKVLESGGRVEKLIAQVAWSPMLSFHSLWWFWVQCHLLVLVHYVFWKPTSLHPFTKTFWSTSCFLLLTSFLKMLISFSRRIWPLPTLPKASWLNDHGVGVPDWPANSPDLNIIENLWGIVKRKMRNKRPKNADELKTVKETWALIPPQQCHKLITSMPRRIEAVVKAKVPLPSIEYVN